MKTTKKKERVARLGIILFAMLATGTAACKAPDGVVESVDWTTVERELELGSYDLEAAAEYLDADQRDDALKLAGYMKQAADALASGGTADALDILEVAISFAEAVADANGGPSDDLRLTLDALRSVVRRLRVYSDAPVDPAPATEAE